MILNDALYFINAGKGITFKEIIVQDYGMAISLDGKKMLELIEKDVYETKELLNNEIIKLGCSMGEEGDEDYNSEWASLYETLSLLIESIDDEVDHIAIEPYEDGEQFMYIGTDGGLGRCIKKAKYLNKRVDKEYRL